VYVLTAVGAILGWLPLATLSVFLSLPLAIDLCRHVNANHDRPERVSNCKFIAVSLHFWSGLLLGLGLIV
jgi:1,4-dihydroxy-2-naphthoate octaprenyltransferase